MLRPDLVLGAKTIDYAPKLAPKLAAALAFHVPYARKLRPMSEQLAAAVAAGDVAAARMLLDAGADPNGSGEAGLPLLHVAALVGPVALASLLLERGADPGRADEASGGTAAHVAATSDESLDALRVVVDADDSLVDAPDWVGDTPLHVAARHGAVESARALLETCASTERRNLHGRTPLGVAGDFAVKRLLLSYALQDDAAWADDAARAAEAAQAAELARAAEFARGLAEADRVAADAAAALVADAAAARAAEAEAEAALVAEAEAVVSAAEAAAEAEAARVAEAEFERRRRRADAARARERASEAAAREEEARRAAVAAAPEVLVEADCYEDPAPRARVATPPTTPTRERLAVATPTRPATATPIRPPRPPDPVASAKDDGVRALDYEGADRPAAPRRLAALVACVAVAAAVAAGLGAGLGAVPRRERRSARRVAKRLSAVDARLDAADAAVTRLDAADAARDIEVAALDAGLGELGAGLGELGAGLGEVGATDAARAARVDELAWELEAFRAEAGATWAARVEELAWELGAVRAALAEGDAPRRAIAPPKPRSLLRAAVREFAVPATVAAVFGGAGPLAAARRLWGLLRRCRRFVLAAVGTAAGGAALLGDEGLAELRRRARGTGVGIAW